MWLPDALRMKRGSIPTDLNALTGLLTPPGIICRAISNNSWERSFFIDSPLRRIRTCHGNGNSYHRKRSEVNAIRPLQPLFVRTFECSLRRIIRGFFFLTVKRKCNNFCDVVYSIQYLL